ncbi:hypothetical protein GUJ93_ZPchr0014g47004 [Zizania palustris]|uniref:Uncharacterized protein n=1 Tax=Zizania palustris TaxID=103762 RepID=A0A8J5SXC6_ZIZPA|nr:hypothetical protein GUJ93_ZPchr0014g47004 [Zizania palustris]
MLISEPSKNEKENGALCMARRGRRREECSSHCVSDDRRTMLHAFAAVFAYAGVSVMRTGGWWSLYPEHILSRVSVCAQFCLRTKLQASVDAGAAASAPEQGFAENLRRLASQTPLVIERCCCCFHEPVAIAVDRFEVFDGAGHRAFGRLFCDFTLTVRHVSPPGPAASARPALAIQ